jgi:hypothetical protein
MISICAGLRRGRLDRKFHSSYGCISQVGVDRELKYLRRDADQMAWIERLLAVVIDIRRKLGFLCANRSRHSFAFISSDLSNLVSSFKKFNTLYSNFQSAMSSSEVITKTVRPPRWHCCYQTCWNGTHLAVYRRVPALVMVRVADQKKAVNFVITQRRHGIV